MSRQVGGEAVKFIPLQGLQELAIRHAPKLPIVYLYIEEGRLHFPGQSIGFSVPVHQPTLLLLWELVLLEGLPNVPKVGGEVTACQFHRVVRQVAPLIAGVEIPVEGEVQLQLHWVGLENTEVIILQVEGCALAVVPVHQEPACGIHLGQRPHGAVRNRSWRIVRK